MSLQVVHSSRVSLNSNEPNMESILITNDGPLLTSTNYWDIEHARAGLCYLTWNAGAARLLIPDSLLDELPAMKVCSYVIVSRGPWPAQGDRDGVELLFEDHGDEPFSLCLSSEQTDRLLPATDHNAHFALTGWTRTGQAFAHAGRYRVVAQVPCLEPWHES